MTRRPLLGDETGADGHLMQAHFPSDTSDTHKEEGKEAAKKKKHVKRNGKDTETKRREERALAPPRPITHPPDNLVLPQLPLLCFPVASIPDDKTSRSFLYGPVRWMCV